MGEPKDEEEKRLGLSTAEAERVAAELEREMRAAAQNLEFEKAAALRDQVFEILGINRRREGRQRTEGNVPKGKAGKVAIVPLFSPMPFYIQKATAQESSTLKREAPQRAGRGRKAQKE